VTKALHDRSIAELGSLLRDGQLTAEALAEHSLSRIEQFDGGLHAFVAVTADRALEDAREADRAFEAGHDRGPMQGIPYALKDVFDTAGIATTCHSKLLADYVPHRDATVQARLKDGGGVLIGKLATHEYALGGPSFDLPFPPARNPWNVDHIPGASSSGSGVAVAAGFLPLALGSDTSGSIRGPACHCGVVGLKPTYGLVSRRGVFPLSYSLDHCGPLTWTVADAAQGMEVIAGHDPLDPSSARVPPPNFSSGLDLGLDDMRIGYARNFFSRLDVTAPEVLAVLDQVAERLSKMGATVEEVALPDFELFNAAGRIIMTAEAYAIHEEDLRDRPLDYGRYTYQRIAPGVALSAADLLQAHRLRRELAIAVDGALQLHDVLLTASCLAPAPAFDEFPEDWPPPASASATNTIPFNVSGHPALALPTGDRVEGLPLGMQLVGRAFDEPTVLQVGAAYEANFGASPRERPDLQAISRA